MINIITFDSVELLIIILITCFFFFTIKYFVCRKGSKEKKIKNIVYIFFIIYIIGLLDYTFFPIAIFKEEALVEVFGTIQGAPKKLFYQLYPGVSIKEYIYYRNYYQLIGNVIMLMPMVIFLFFACKIKLKWCIILGSSFSLIIEVMQLIIDLITKYPNRFFDVDDLILNIFGVLIISVVIKIFNLIISKKNVGRM